MTRSPCQPWGGLWSIRGGGGASRWASLPLSNLGLSHNTCCNTWCNTWCNIWYNILHSCSCTNLIILGTIQYLVAAEMIISSNPVLLSQERAGWGIFDELWRIEIKCSLFRNHFVTHFRGSLTISVIGWQKYSEKLFSLAPQIKLHACRKGWISEKFQTAFDFFGSSSRSSPRPRCRLFWPNTDSIYMFSSVLSVFIHFICF